MTLRTDDEIRRYLSAAWECVERGESVDWWALRGKWHKGEPFLPPMAGEAPRPTEPTAAVVTPVTATERHSLDPWAEAAVEGDVPVLEPALTRAVAWEQLRGLWDDIESVEDGEANELLRPLLDASWADVRDAAARVRAVLEQRAWIISACSAQPGPPFVAPLLRLLVMPERLTGTDRQLFRDAVHRTPKTSEGFRLFCHKLGTQAPTLSRDNRDLLDFLKRRPTTTVAPLQQPASTPIGTVLIVIVAVVIPILRFAINMGSKSSSAPKQNQSVPNTPTPRPVFPPPVIPQPGVQNSQNSGIQWVDPEREAALLELHRVMQRMQQTDNPNDQTQALQEMFELQQRDPRKFRELSAERSRRLAKNPRAFDDPALEATPTLPQAPIPAPAPSSAELPPSGTEAELRQLHAYYQRLETARSQGEPATATLGELGRFLRSLGPRMPAVNAEYKRRLAENPRTFDDPPAEPENPFRPKSKEASE